MINTCLDEKRYLKGQSLEEWNYFLQPYACTAAFYVDLLNISGHIPIVKLYKYYGPEAHYGDFVIATNKGLRIVSRDAFIRLWIKRLPISRQISYSEEYLSKWTISV